MAASLADLQRQYSGKVSDLRPPNPENKRYNIPARLYKREDPSSPWGWSAVFLQGDPENYVYYQEEKGYTRVPDAEAAGLLADQDKLRKDYAVKVLAERGQEEKEKNHPTVIVAATDGQAPTPAAPGFTAAEMAEFRAFLSERKRVEPDLTTDSLLEQNAIDTPTRSYSCRKCGDTFVSPAQVSKHSREVHRA